MSADTVDFGAIAQRHRPELHVHCYRMLASFDDAEDAVQETFVLALRSAAAFDGVNPRAWLYKIATNVCLDAIRRRNRRAAPQAAEEVSWLQPYPDSLLDAAASGPDALVVARETIELAFLVAVQTLPARQRAVLLLRDVVGCSASEAAAALDTSVPAANSALQRARETLRAHLPRRRSDWSGTSTPEEARLVRRLVEAHEGADLASFKELLRADVSVAMPPHGLVYRGVAALEPLFDVAFEPGNEWHLLVTAANRQPATASYRRRVGQEEYVPVKLDVFRFEQGAVAEILTFGPQHFDRFGLPGVVSGP